MRGLMRGETTTEETNLMRIETTIGITTEETTIELNTKGGDNMLKGDKKIDKKEHRSNGPKLRKLLLGRTD
jgi:hypothetical protein